MTTSPELITLADREPVPYGSVTFGQLIAEARHEKEAEAEASRRVKMQRSLYARWVRMARRHISSRYPDDHPIYVDIRVWELYVCRFDASAEAWFFSISDDGRVDLCILSRTLRRNAKR